MHPNPVHGSACSPRLLAKLGANRVPSSKAQPPSRAAQQPRYKEWPAAAASSSLTARWRCGTLLQTPSKSAHPAQCSFGRHPCKNASAGSAAAGEGSANARAAIATPRAEPLAALHSGSMLQGHCYKVPQGRGQQGARETPSRSTTARPHPAYGASWPWPTPSPPNPTCPANWRSGRAPGGADRGRAPTTSSVGGQRQQADPPVLTWAGCPGPGQLQTGRRGMPSQGPGNPARACCTQSSRSPGRPPPSCQRGWRGQTLRQPSLMFR